MGCNLKLLTQGEHQGIPRHMQPSSPGTRHPSHTTRGVGFAVRPISRILGSLHYHQFMGPSSNNPGTVTPVLVSRLSNTHNIQTNNRAFQISWMKTPGSCVLGNPSAQLLHLLLMLALLKGNCRSPAGARKISACKAGNSSLTHHAAYSWK